MHYLLCAHWTTEQITWRSLLPSAVRDDGNVTTSSKPEQGLGDSSGRTDDLVPLGDKPMVELVRRVPAIGLADLPDQLVSLRALGLLVQLQLVRAHHVLAELPAFVINVSVDRHDQIPL